jgi:hypothetical protein
VNFCSPKLVVLTLFASYFLAQNLYQYITNPPMPPAEPLPEVDEWENFWALYDRFQGYLYITIVGFVVFYFLRKSNDRVEEEKYLAAKQLEEQKEERERKLQAEREERIIRKLEEEERAAEEKQMRIARSNTNTGGAREERTKSE